MRLKKTFVVFSGYNDRANIAFYRAAVKLDVSFHIVALTRQDKVFLTDYVGNVFFVRETSELTLSLFERIIDRFREVSDVSEKFILPNSEYLNWFLLQNRIQLQDMGWSISLPPNDVYSLISNKESATNWVGKFDGIEIPSNFTFNEIQFPCVAKPKLNVSSGYTQYPVFLNLESDLADFEGEDSSFFFQEFIKGKSYYFCAYVSSCGRTISYWQENIAQQPGGKSILLARSCSNPGVQVTSIIDGLRELDFTGPIMMEVILSQGEFYFIEFNPRLWGPLDLARSACPSLFELLFEDLGFDVSFHSPEKVETHSCWYAWGFGALGHDYVVYPADDKDFSVEQVFSLICENDLYKQSDTSTLTLRF